MTSSGIPSSRFGKNIYRISTLYTGTLSRGNGQRNGMMILMMKIQKIVIDIDFKDNLAIVKGNIEWVNKRNGSNSRIDIQQTKYSW